jgi:signal transduction histidine kinase
MLAKIFMAKGQLFHFQKKVDSALFYYRAYIALAGKGNAGRQSSGITAAKINIGQLFLTVGLPDSTLYYSQQVLTEMAKEPRSDSGNRVIVLYNMAQAFLAQKKYQSAIDVAEPASETALSLPASYQYTGHEILSKAYAGAGKYDLAWREQNLYSALKDSLARTDNLRTISQMEAKYQLADRKKELAEKELAISKKNASIKTKNYLIGGIIAAFLLLIAIYLQQQRLRQYKLNKQAEIDRLNASIQAVELERSRIARELHDGIGGLLGSIGLQLGAVFKTHNIEDSSGDFRNIQQLVSDAYIELRQTSHNLMPETLKYEGLIRATEHFCRGVSRGGALKINFESSGKIPTLSPDVQLAIYRIIQELIHNIIKHARADHAMVQLNAVNDQLSVTVEDNGIGMKNTSGKDNDGMGLKTIRERVDMLNGVLDISSAPGEGTSFNMVFFSLGENNTIEYDDKNSDNG